jgi:hypothetical protein
MLRRYRFLIVVAVLGIGLGVAWLFAVPHDGWNGQNLHSTAKPWAEKDIFGSWQYRENGGTSPATITITFNPDGTFDQLIMPDNGGARLTQRGSWAIRGTTTQPTHRGLVEGRLNVYDALMYDGGGWRPHDWDWWLVIDSPQRPGQLAISGGTFPDPDVYQEFLKLP